MKKLLKSKIWLSLIIVLGLGPSFTGGFATAKLTQKTPSNLPANGRGGTPPTGTPPEGSPGDSSSNSDSNSNSSNSSDSSSDSSSNSSNA